MTQIKNHLNDIRFKKEFNYAQLVPTFVNNNTGLADEIARWVLDRNSILYKNESHAPGLLKPTIAKLTGKDNPENCPVLQMTDALIYNAESIIHFYEQRCTPQNRLIPKEANAANEVLELYHLFTGEFFEGKVNRYLYSQLLTSASFAKPVFKEQVSSGQKFLLSIGFGSVKKSINNEYDLSLFHAEDYLKEIKKIFSKVDDLLTDGRRYLVGECFTLADLSFAAIAAAMVLPEEFGGALPNISQVPDDYRNAVIELRATAAGQFALRMYLENRTTARPQSEIPKEKGILARIVNGEVTSLAKNQYKLFYFLQKHFPVLKLPFLKLVLVCKNDLVTEVLNRDNDFTIEEINAKKMSAQKGAFFLGMDRNNPQFDRERDFVRRASHREDLEMIRKFVRSQAEEIINSAHQYGKLDVSASFARVILVRLLDYYFGTPSPNEPLMIEWNKVMFYDLFLNFTNNKKKHDLACEYGVQRMEWVVSVINERQEQRREGKEIADNLLNRMIHMAEKDEYKWADVDVIQRNIGGLLTGIQEGTNKSLILILEELFSRPDTLQAAIEVANSGDMDKMYGYVKEAMRFNPTQPGVIRYSETTQTIKGNGSKQYTIKPKRTVMTLTSSAMFDPAAFPDPKKFISDRTSTYMNYGFALHECYGKYINAVTLTEMTAAILRLKNVRLEPGSAGKGMGLTDGPFPVNYVVCFD